jgi:hypothetical protein
MTCTDCQGQGHGQPFEPVKVHLVADSTKASPGPGPRPRRLTGFTKVMTSAIPLVDLVPYDPARLYIEVQATSNDVVICTDLSQAQDPANVASGIPNPNGILIPHANTTPQRLEGANRMWAVAAAYPALLTVAVMHEEN